MWTNIVGGLVLLFVATYVIQFFFLGTKPKPGRSRTHWDVPPILGFFGVLLLGLSFVEAMRRIVIEAWGLGIGLGIIISVSFWFARTYRSGMTAKPRESRLRLTIRFLRTFGAPLFVLLLATYLAVRIFGAVVEVFIAGALGVLILAIAILMLSDALRARMKSS
jgi:hypothetical protein